MNLLIIFIIKYYLIIPILISGIYFLKQSKENKKGIFLLALVSFPLIYLIAQIGTHLYFDPRPFTITGIASLVLHAPDNGFPSDHILLLSAIAMLVSYFNKKLSIFLWISTLLVGMMRVYAGIHHPIDILGSILISMLVTSIIYLLIQKYERQRKTREKNTQII